MGESRPASTPADPAGATASAPGLSPLQKAYSAYVRHALYCRLCRDIDSGGCPAADELWRAYRRECDEAYRTLSASDR